MNRVRKKKHILYASLALVGLYIICQALYLYDDHHFTPLKPLYNAKNEASRLLKFLTTYHYQCNITTQIGNRSYWPICLETSMAVDLESKDRKISYSVGSSYDYVLEKNLASNFSFHVVIVSPVKVPTSIQKTSNITVINTNLVPNDYADFSRNSYGQSTVNLVMEQQKHKRIEILKLKEISTDWSLWEMLHFMIADHLLPKTKQLFVEVAIDKLDDDYLYNWYRVLYELFYKAGFRLYHTAASDSLCLQVTLMQSCVYYMSWIQDPGPNFLIMHPPADYGTLSLEESRLLTYLSSDHVQCDSTQSIGHASGIVFDVCVDNLQAKDTKPCIVYSFTQHSMVAMEQELAKYDCRMITFTVSELSDRMRTLDDVTHYQILKYKNQYRSVVSVMEMLLKEDSISLLLVDVEDFELTLLGQAMNVNALKNVSQIVMTFHETSKIHGKHPTIIRRKFSELKRLSTHGFQIFQSQEISSESYKTRPDLINCCFQVGLLKQPKATYMPLKYRPWIR